MEKHETVRLRFDHFCVPQEQSPKAKKRYQNMEKQGESRREGGPSRDMFFLFVCFLLPLSLPLLFCTSCKLNILIISRNTGDTHTTIPPT